MIDDLDTTPKIEFPSLFPQSLPRPPLRVQSRQGQPSQLNPITLRAAIPARRNASALGPIHPTFLVDIGPDDDD